MAKMQGQATSGSGNMLFRMIPPAANMGWNTKNRAESPTRGAPVWVPKYYTPPEGARRTWDKDQLETLLRDKINQKTAGSNGKILQAIRLFDRDNGIITAAAWRRALPKLVGIELKDEESMSLFNKYDEDGGGEIDTYEFIENVLPPDFAKRREMAQDEGEVVPTDYEGPKVSVPPGFGGHLPGNSRRYGLSYGSSAQKAWTTKEPKTPGVFREVAIPPSLAEAGSFPGHLCQITPVRVRAATPGLTTRPSVAGPMS